MEPSWTWSWRRLVADGAGEGSQSWSSGIRYMCQWHLRIFCGYDFGNFWVIVPEPPAAAAAADRTPTTTPTLSGRD